MNTKELEKIELHLHLEACVSVPTLRRIAARNQYPLPAHLADTETHFFDNFEQFVRTFQSIGNTVQKESDFVDIINDCLDYLRDNNIVYAEVSCTPIHYIRKGLRFAHILGIMNNEIARRGQEGKVRFIIDTQRDHGLEVAQQVFSQVYANRDSNIVGVGLTGYEEGNSPAVFEYLFRDAAQMGFGCTAHAGEYADAEDVWQCIRHLGVSRIGHGISAINDLELMHYAKENRIHFEVCPTSNLRLKRVGSPAQHPFPAFFRHGMSISLNSDDPLIFNCTLSDEFQNIINWYQFEEQDIKQLLDNAREAAFGL